jgi:hypothetical protein
MKLMKKTMVFTISVFSLGLWRGFRGKRETEVNSYEIAMKPIAVVFASLMILQDFRQALKSGSNVTANQYASAVSLA